MALNFDSLYQSVDSFALRTDHNYLVNIIYSFVTGIIFSPFNNGFKYFIFYLIAWELFYMFVTKLRYPYYNLETRVATIYSSFLGYIIGRTLIVVINKNPFDPDDPIDPVAGQTEAFKDRQAKLIRRSIKIY